MWVSGFGWPCCLPVPIRNGPPPSIPFPLTVSITSPPPHHPAVSNNATVRSHSNSNNPTPERKQEEQRDISGSAVLWALQKAAAQKKLKKKKKKKKKKKQQQQRESSSPTRSHVEKETVDYSNVKPLQINHEWGVKLAELEKRLHQLDDYTA